MHLCWSDGELGKGRRKYYTLWHKGKLDLGWNQTYLFVFGFRYSVLYITMMCSRQDPFPLIEKFNRIWSSNIKWREKRKRKSKKSVGGILSII